MGYYYYVMQGFPTCGPRGNFGRPAKSNASIYLLPYNETRIYYITIFWFDLSTVVPNSKKFYTQNSSENL